MAREPPATFRLRPPSRAFTKFRPDAVEIRHLEGGRLAKVLLELQRHRRDYFDHLVSHLAEALFFTACRFHEWALLTGDRLVTGRGE